MYLKDRVKHSEGWSKQGASGGFNQNKKKKEICKRFNKGLCTAGLSCKYDHHCLECGKFGNGEHICRRKSNNEGNRGGSGNHQNPSNTPNNGTGSNQSSGQVTK